MTGYPLLLDLTGRRVVVVGGGAVASRRTQSLVESGAVVTVIAPVVDPSIDVAEVLLRPYADASDLLGAWLVLACTDDPAVNAAVAADAEAAGTWCVRADDAAASAARVPAVARAEGVTVAVNADTDPRRATAVRDAVRDLLRAGELPLRRRRPGPGSVALVGGGPGDPGLITLRGRQLLAQADVVVVDKLAPRELLEGLDDDVVVLDAGKSPHRHNMTQDEINEALVSHAQAGRRVVRLKGGDPFVFGRGGEEALACLAAGIPVEVVPGITSAIAVPAAAGIPVTHRGVTQDFTVVSAHLDPRAPGSTIDYPALAAGPGTIVFLMAVDRLTAIAAELVAHGRPADTPVAVVESGTTAQERVTIGTLADIAATALEVGVAPPAVVVVGEVVRLRDSLRDSLRRSP